MAFDGDLFVWRFVCLAVNGCLFVCGWCFVHLSVVGDVFVRLWLEICLFICGC